MIKNKKNTLKIIHIFVLFIFIFSLVQNISIKKAEAVEPSKKLDWVNPNKNSNNPYKLTTDALLNPKTMMAVVGCTGIVDKVSTAATNFLKNSLNKVMYSKALKLIGKETIEKYCAQGKAIAKTAVSGAPTILGNGVDSAAIQVAIEEMGLCNNTDNTKDRAAILEIQKTNAILDATKKREECFNGLAYTLAKNQLTSMTQETMNWVNTGFKGDPLYVQNITSLTRSIEKNVLMNGIEVLSFGAFPYGDTFTDTLVKNFNNRDLSSSSSNFLNSLASDLSNFVTDTKSYTDLGILTPKQRAQRSIDSFSNDFSTGGWDGYMALTQRDQNNPLGFTMQASQYLADRIEQQTTETKNELIENNGFLSQKECTLWQNYDDKGNPIREGGSDLFKETVVNGIKIKAVKEISYSNNKKNKNDKCVKWKVTTPGSMIKDKLSTYINSPERQLEMANNINQVLNNLFTNLIESFRSEGLFGLSQEGYFDSNSNYGTGGYGYNADYQPGIEYDKTTDPSGFSYDSDFDLTRDLGNTYIRAKTRSLGKWDAKNNKIKDPRTDTWIGGELNIGLGIWNSTLSAYEPPNYYYTVEIPGNTKLFNNGYSGWAIGDRAFWDGEKWQNWKKDQTSPIKDRGIIQIQSDYILAAKEILKVLPGLMPKKGELDYCIPGPNPNYEQNSKVTESLFSDYLGTLGGSYIPGKFFKRDATEIQVAQKGSQPYDDYKSNITQGGSDDLFKRIAIFGESDPKIPTRQFNSIWQNIQMFLGMYKSDEKEDMIMEQISKLQVDIQKGIQGFFSNYSTKVFDNLYTKKMRTEFIEDESTSILKENKSYLSILDEAYSFTNKMYEDDENINDAISEYKDSIAQAQSNTSRLNLIRSEVSKIIKDAQDRRNANLIEILKKEAIRENRKEPLTEAQYKEEYKECLEEEDILYFNENDIVKNSDTDTEKERCTDGIDNDLDGLVDKKDTDCQ